MVRIAIALQELRIWEELSFYLPKPVGLCSNHYWIQRFVYQGQCCKTYFSFAFYIVVSCTILMLKGSMLLL